MKISDVIRQLQELQELHGDNIKVKAYNHAGDFDDIGVVETQDYFGVQVVVIEP